MAARQRLADLLAGEPGKEEQVATLLTVAAADRKHLAASILDEVGTRLVSEGEASARAYLTRLGELDPLLGDELREEIDRRRAAGSAVTAGVAGLVTPDR